MDATETKNRISGAAKKRRRKRREPFKTALLAFLLAFLFIALCLILGAKGKKQDAVGTDSFVVAAPVKIQETDAQAPEIDPLLPPLRVITPCDTEFERGTWKTRFQSSFSKVTSRSKDSYKSENISIYITKNVRGGQDPCVYYVADIYIAQIENLQSYMSPGKLGWYCKRSAKQLTRESGAILSINGDNCLTSPEGLLVRNGDVFSEDEYSGDICVLYADGSMETYLSGCYSAQDIIASSPYQIWRYGPALLDENGKAKKEFDSPAAMCWENARSGIGYFEPGHYCFVAVEGQYQSSPGLELDKFAAIFQYLGCKSAYNLPGGAFTVMSFGSGAVNRLADGGRELGDIILIKEID